MTVRDRDVRPPSDAGFTLIELLVTMLIATIVLLAVLKGADSFAQGTKRADDVTRAEDAARTTMREMIGVIREGRLPTAAQAGLATTPSTPIRLADATTGDVIVATGTAAAPGWTRYCADGSGSLLRGQSSGATFVAPAACGVASAGWSYGKLLSRTLVNGRDTLFQFSSGSCVSGQPIGAGAVCPPAANTITTVGIRLSVAGVPGSDTIGTTLRNAVSVRNGSPS